MKDARDIRFDEKLKTQLKQFRSSLYSQSLSSCQRSLVDREIQKCKLTLSYSSDSVTTVLSIVKLVAVNPPTAHVTRLLFSF